MGYTARAVLALGTSVGLFWLGAAMVGDRIWYFQLFEPFSWLAPLLNRVPLQLLPESPNLGCTIALALLRDSPASEQATYDWLRLIRVPVPQEHLGLLLTGATGVIASLWAADAHWLAQGKPGRARVSPTLAAAMSWLLPGSGHAAVGQRQKGMLVGAAVLVMFLAGLLLSQGNGVDRPLRAAWWIPQILFGSGTAAASLITAPLAEGSPGQWLDHGVAMCSVAGLMNLVVMIDAYTAAEVAEAAPAPAAAGGIP
jgi:hypothetical protein